MATPIKNFVNVFNMTFDSGKFPSFDMRPITQEFFSPQDFLDQRPNLEEQIASATPVPPILGKPGFGWIKVIYRHPIYKCLPTALSRDEE